MKKVYIASANPVKIECARRAFEAVFPGISFEFKGFESRTDVNRQPFGEKETLKGAINRLQYIRKKFPDGAYWVGIEGGIEIIENSMHAFAWIVVMNEKRTGKSRTATFEIPSGLRKLVERGYELGEADDAFFNRNNSKQKDGTVGRLTHGKIDRMEYYTHTLVLALIPFIDPDIYP